VLQRLQIMKKYNVFHKIIPYDTFKIRHTNSLKKSILCTICTKCRRIVYYYNMLGIYSRVLNLKYFNIEN